MTLENFLKEPWELINPLRANNIKIELSREICEDHPLYNINCEPIAARKDNDDVLFKIITSSYSYAIVHLTWSGKKEINPVFPRVEFYTDIHNLKEKGLPSPH